MIPRQNIRGCQRFLFFFKHSLSLSLSLSFFFADNLKKKRKTRQAG